MKSWADLLRSSILSVTQSSIQTPITSGLSKVTLRPD